MRIKNRTLLVVEDDKKLNLQYRMGCQLALRELGFSAEAAKDAVKQAFNLSQAQATLKEHVVDFASIDIALAEEEENLTEEAREAVEPGGITLLKELQRYEKQPISVVVTGERLDSYVLDAWKKYGVLTYYKKGDFGVVEEYKNAVKAALLYQDAAELIAEPETEFDIEHAEGSWHKALEAGKIAGVRERDFPEALGHRIRLARDNRTHSITGLSVDRWTQEKLERMVVGRKDWALIRVTIKGFDEFVRAYPSQEEPILTFVADLLKGARDAFDDQELFIGHLGHHKDASLVVIPGTESFRLVSDMNRWRKDIARWVRGIEEEFQQQAPNSLSVFGLRDLTLTLEAMTWVGADADSAEPMFTDLHQLLDALGPAQM
jgi:hypothetical protein